MIDGDAELLAYYLATADARVERLEEAIESARKDRGDRARDGLRQVVHRVAGSAGTYGFGELTKTARALESRLGAGTQVDDAVMSAAVSLLDDMKRAFAAARRQTQSIASALELEPESETASEVEITAGADDAPAGLALPALPAAPQPAPEKPRVIVPPPPIQPAAKGAPLIALFVGKGNESSAQAAARSVASALAQAGVHLVCCGEGPCLSAAAQGFAESGGTAFRLESREARACADADGVVLLRGTSFEPVPGARGKPMVRASTKPQDAVIELLELLARAECEAAA